MSSIDRLIYITQDSTKDTIVNDLSVHVGYSFLFESNELIDKERNITNDTLNLKLYKSYLLYLASENKLDLVNELCYNSLKSEDYSIYVNVLNFADICIDTILKCPSAHSCNNSILQTISKALDNLNIDELDTEELEKEQSIRKRIKDIQIYIDLSNIFIDYEISKSVSYFKNFAINKDDSNLKEFVLFIETTFKKVIKKQSNTSIVLLLDHILSLPTLFELNDQIYISDILATFLTEILTCNKVGLTKDFISYMKNIHENSDDDDNDADEVDDNEEEEEEKKEQEEISNTSLFSNAFTALFRPMANIQGASSNDAASALLKAATDTSYKFFNTASSATNTLLNVASFGTHNSFSNMTYKLHVNDILSCKKMAYIIINVVQNFINGSNSTDDEQIQYAENILYLYELIDNNDTNIQLYKQREDTFIKLCSLLSNIFSDIFIVPFNLRKEADKLNLLANIISYKSYYKQINELFLLAKLLASITYTDCIDIIYTKQHNLLSSTLSNANHIFKQYDEQCKLLILSSSLHNNDISFAKQFCLNNMNANKLKTLGTISVQLALDNKEEIDEKLLAYGLWGCKHPNINQLDNDYTLALNTCKNIIEQNNQNIQLQEVEIINNIFNDTNNNKKV